VAKMKELGYKYVSIDLEGYRQGSLNETLKPVLK
jgi:PP-loop superfamily ATP-utilizing enzyme